MRGSPVTALLPAEPAAASAPVAQVWAGPYAGPVPGRRWGSPLIASGSPGQSPVSLVAADGETLSGTTQSNFAGNGFYTRNGFTRARDWVGPNPLGGNFAGFDDYHFLPISTWLTDYGGLTAATAYSRMDDLGLNGMMPASGAISLNDLITYGKWAVVASERTTGSITAGQKPYVVGVSAGEEPSTQVQYETIRSDADTWISGYGGGIFHAYNFTDNLMNGEVAGVYFPEDMVIGWVSSDGGTRTRRQYTAMDQYWFAGSPNDAASSNSKLHSRLYFNEFAISGAATTTQAARGSHYGSSIDSIRKAFSAGGNSLPGGPFHPWIEAAAPYGEVDSAAIAPSQLKWAVWATLVHGARAIGYFVHNFRTGDSWGGAFWDDHFGAPGVAGTGIYAAAKEVNRNALTVAEAINGPFDGYFVYGDLTTGGAISTSGFLTSVTSTNSRTKYGGVDASCKWAPVERKHYIFATTREAESATSVPITCRMVDQGQTAATPVFGGGALSISRGGGIPAGFCEFSDTFALASDYRCWRID